MQPVKRRKPVIIPSIPIISSSVFEGSNQLTGPLNEPFGPPATNLEPAGMPFAASSNQVAPAAVPAPNNGVNTSSSGFPAFSQAAATVISASDRYAALADLDSLFSQPLPGQSSTWDNRTYILLSWFQISCTVSPLGVISIYQPYTAGHGFSLTGV